MSTAIPAEAKREQPDEALSAPQVLPLTAAGVRQSSPASPAKIPAASAPHQPITSATPGVDPFDFERANRIHVKDGSIFLDGYRVINPRELAPGNEQKLHDKLALAESVNNPSFYESPDRLAIALNLAQIMAVSPQAKESGLRKKIDDYNKELEAGADAKLAKLINDKEHPFAAIVRDTIEQPAKDPVGTDTLKNGVGIYLLMREKLTALGYRNTLTSYVSHAKTPDQVLSDLGEKIGISPLQVREAALKGGLDGVGKLLGLTPDYVADVKQLTSQAAGKEFSLNLIEHWHLGRQLLKDQPSSFEQKIATGKEARIVATIEQARSRVHQRYEVPDPIKHEEMRIAEAMNLVEPIQRALMFKLGYEIGYTPEVTADNIAYYPGIYGLHRKAANDLRDTNGTYHIYFSGRGDLKGSMRTLVHEIAHNLWPEQFSAQEVKKIDALAAGDAQRFAALSKLVDEKFSDLDKFVRAYQSCTDDASRSGIAAKVDKYFAEYGVPIDNAILPYIKDAHDLQFLVKHAQDTLQIEGKRYTVSGYDSSHERFREEISRFAELKQVEYRSQPQLLNFVAPGWNQIWENHYLPHLSRVYDGLAQVAAKKNSALDSVVHREATSAAPAFNEVAPKVAERPQQPTAEPKVEQRPAMPAPTAIMNPPPSPAPVETPKPQVTAAGMADGIPLNTVDAASIVHNSQTLAALKTLGSMGIAARG